jgi:hypothetical protein
MTDHTFTGWAFVTMFVLAFIYMGTLSLALEGYRLASQILGTIGLTIMVAATIACLLQAFTRGE